MNKYFIFILTLLPTLLNGQNLVPNNSFEDYVACPASPGWIDSVSFWHSYSWTPDYFNNCAPSCPLASYCLGYENWAGYQLPYHGFGYAGISLRDYDFANTREYLGCKLMAKLVVGRKYYVSAFISRGNGYASYGACNNFGFQLFTYSHSSNDPCVITNSSIYHDTLIVTDSINWTNINGTFIADSAYEYLALGNFYDDAHTDTVDLHHPPLSFNDCYYYVDYVQLIDDSIWQTTNTENIKEFQNIRVSPSIFTDYLNIDYYGKVPAELIIYDSASRIVYKKTISGSININTTLFINGFYYYVLYTNINCASGRVIKIND